MTFSDYCYLVKSDLYRIDGDVRLRTFWRELLVGDGGFCYCFWWRTSHYLKHRLILFWLFPFAWLILRHYRFRFGISIPLDTEIGSGLYIGHFGGIVVNGRTRIGKNCNISHGVTLGQSSRGVSEGVPTLGNNVFIGPGAMIFGNVRVGHNAAIGANAVVTRDVPENAVVVGIPAQIINMKGSNGCVNYIDYENVLRGKA